jgi:adenylosuccinate synthase
MGKLMVVVGGQFGSEAKGACAAALAARSNSPLVIRTGGPNAGHTVWREEIEYKLRQLPTAAVSNPTARIALAAGSVVDPELLAKEMAATVLEPRHLDQEAQDAGLHNWSTQKGIGAARADRIMRKAKIWRDQYFPGTAVSDVGHLARRQLQTGGDVIIEAAQGYGLGLHTNYYPKTTSADCRAIDALADVGLSPWWVSSIMGVELEIWVVMRPYPIRVAGESGPLRHETTWGQLGLPEEHTTVTNKVRRVGTWDHALAEAALAANGAPSKAVRVWFSMMDQVIPEIAGLMGPPDTEELSSTAWDQLDDWNQIIRAAGSRIAAVGTGPATHIFWED